ncbi:hypothetical protein AB0M39_08050 [Streptomyces sp. NPDC051907]|uniref:hypothetical protein n=1 Tax=Streptomyces sp. NPDC051907 TaxID=3155284 RepID=UPI00343E4DFC
MNTNKPMRRLALAGAVLTQTLLLSLAAPAAAGAATPAATTTAAVASVEEGSAAAGSRVTVKAGWELARIRAYARGDSEIVGEIKPGESWPCSTAGCGTVRGGHITACDSAGDQWYAIHYYGYVRYVSATCGTSI